MGLADLKKNASLCKAERPIAVSIDDFIAAADLYAAGKSTPSISSAKGQTHNEVLEPTNVVDFLQRKYPNQPQPLVKASSGSKPFKRCTYTLSESAIDQLTQLSQQGNIAKSKLIRQLINHYFSLTPEQQKRIDANLG
ncbi:hypothetical protein [Shewanella litoralis]|uniref:CopG family transcriptional regulator n=1 Tax=Shewanella litoralis TaxID=2282700 RepID=A0ABQ2R7G0_9GAMM|nr:hypothetical protein [Shewanella litoralis]GGQ13784.1 CopG family transcriptional regulator [Shewanella litoralis]